MNKLLKMEEFKVFVTICFLAILSEFGELPSNTKLDGIHYTIYVGAIIFCGLFTLVYAFRMLETTEKSQINKKLFKLFSLVVLTLILVPNILKIALY